MIALATLTVIMDARVVTKVNIVKLVSHVLKMNTSYVGKSTCSIWICVLTNVKHLTKPVKMIVLSNITTRPGIAHVWTIVRMDALA